MTARLVKGLAGLAVFAILVAVTVYALMPQPVGVDVGTIGRGAMAVTIDEEGMARVRDVYEVSAPVTGTLRRPDIVPGDTVTAGETLVAVLKPVEPALLDARTRQELEAAAAAARAAVQAAEAQRASAASATALAEAEHARALPLAEAGIITEREMDRLTGALDTARAQLGEAEAMLELRRSELATAEARLMLPGQGTAASEDGPADVLVRAPVSGVVLTVLVKSEQVVAAGTPLLAIGDPSRSEVVADLLSSDAVQVAAGAEATIEEWGGDTVLAARLRRIDPAAFTKVSALGIEEQRVNAVLDILAPYEEWRRLGHDFRVMVRIVVWKAEDVVQVPLAALFREGEGWAVFKEVDGRAVVQPVGLGHRNEETAEVVSGLVTGDTVILHPSDQIADGSAVAPRQAE